MSWSHPLLLLLLAVPAAGLLGGLHAGGRGAPRRRWPALARVGVTGSRVHRSGGGPARRPWMLWLALALAVAALAGPRWGGLGETTEEPAREILIALDLSRSMLVGDAGRTRIERAHAIVKALLDGLGGERAGLVVFSGSAYVQVPLSSDYQIIREFLPSLRPGYIPFGGSDYAAMLRASAGGFSGDQAMDRYLVVIGDGESTTDTWPGELARLRQLGVHVLALGVGTAGGGDVPPRRWGDKSPAHSRLEAGTLQTLASATGGIYRDATAGLDVRSLLAETVELGKRTHRAEREADHAAERFQWFLVPALALGLFGLWREIPVPPRPRTVPRATGGTGNAAGSPAGHAVGAGAGTGTGAGAGAAAAAAALGALAILVACVGPRLANAHDLGDDADVPITAQGRLHKLVAHLAGHPGLEVPDLMRIAELTVNCGIEDFAKGEAVPERVIADGLEAVRYGRQMAPLLPEWDHLTVDLERLRAHQASADAARRPPEEKKQSFDEEDRPPQTNGQGTQQTTSESTGRGGVALSDSVLGELGKEPPRTTGPTPAPRRARQSSGPAGAPATAQAAPSPLRKLLLKNLRDVTREDQPGALFQALGGDTRTEPAGGKDW